MDIFQPAGYIIEAIFTFSAFIIFSGNRYRIELGWQQVFGIFKRKTHFCQTTGTPGFTAVEYKAFQVFTPEVTDLMFADYPADTIDDIAFAATIRANNTRNPFIEIQYGFIGKTFKSFDF
jgi:hypothetical protein